MVYLISRPNYKRWLQERTERGQGQQGEQEPTTAMTIKAEPNDEPAEPNEVIPEAPPPPKISS